MDDDERRELVRRLFYLMTAKLEDAASYAANGQGKEEVTSSIERADHVAVVANEINLVAQATAELLRH